MTSVAISLFMKRIASTPAWALFSAALGISLAWSWYFLPIYPDDSFIAYRYAARFLAGKGLTWNDGEYVEGYSDLLWVLLIALGGVWQPNLIVVGWTLGLASNLATLAALAWAFGDRSRDSLLPVAAGLAALALSSAFAFWGVGGLETALVAALLAWALAIAHKAAHNRRARIAAGLLLGLLAISRPDGILFAIGVAVGLAVRDGIGRAALARACGLVVIPFGFVMAQLAFRVVYYEALVPNTAYAKVAFTLERVWLGFLYVAHGLLANGVALAALLIALWALLRLRRTQALRDLLLFLIPAFMWLAYVDVIGGDFFPFFRHGVPALVCLAFALSAALSGLPRVSARRAAWILALAMGLHLLLQQSVNPWYVPRGRAAAADQAIQARLKVVAPRAPSAAQDPLVSRRRVIEDCLAIGVFLRDAFRSQRPLLAVNYAGCMPYASQLPALDMLGLTDAHIARNRPPDMGHGRLGHELGDGRYVLSRKPDLVAFCVPPTGAPQPCLRGEVELAGMPEFQRDYRLVFYRSGQVEAMLWTRIEDGRLGIERTNDTIRIPGFLLATKQGVRAVLGRTGSVVAAVDDGATAVQDVYIPEGIWEISLQSNADNLTLTTSPEEGVVALRAGGIRVTSPGAVRSLLVQGGEGEVHAITAKRVTVAASGLSASRRLDDDVHRSAM